MTKTPETLNTFRQVMTRAKKHTHNLTSKKETAIIAHPSTSDIFNSLSFNQNNPTVTVQLTVEWPEFLTKHLQNVKLHG